MILEKCVKNDAFPWLSTPTDFCCGFIDINLFCGDYIYSVSWVLKAALQSHQCLGVRGLPVLSSMVSRPVCSSKERSLAQCGDLACVLSVCLSRPVCNLRLLLYGKHSCKTMLQTSGLTNTLECCHWSWPAFTYTFLTHCQLVTVLLQFLAFFVILANPS